jgi:hypothetical protein
LSQNPSFIQKSFVYIGVLKSGDSLATGLSL